jgi:hypothetical protein
MDEEATEPEDRRENTRHKETGLNGLVVASATAEETEAVHKVPVTTQDRK